MKSTLSVLIFCFVSVNQMIAVGSANAKTPMVVPTPTAAGESPVSRPPSPRALTDEELEAADDDGPSSFERTTMPEPFFCEFRLDKGKKGREWISIGSDYPRISPPFEKSEVVSDAYSRHSSAKGPSWGFCVEAEPSNSPTDIKLTIFSHVAKLKSSPDSDSERCQWRSKGKVEKVSASVSLRLAEWGGVEIRNLKNESIRFSAHWPIKTQPDQDGIFCRDFASAMNTKTFNSDRFKKLSNLGNGSK